LSAVSTYAEALFEAAREHDELEEVLEELEEFKNALEDSEEFFEEVLLRYEELVKEHLGRVEVAVTTAVELSEDELDRMKERLGRSLEGREVILQTNVDPNILGGAVFRFGGRMVDSSVRGRLEGLREEMLERGVISG
jgi:F-type H+-transporting ATPase subunit delta